MRISDRRYPALKRLHVLSGVVPVGLFLIAHFAINFTAVLGPDTFNRVARRLDRVPLGGWLELAVIAIPIAAHIVLGALLGNAEGSFSTPHGYPRAWMRPLQRWTGGILVLYVLYHVWSTRLSPPVRSGEPDLFGHMSAHLAVPAVLAFYVLGVLAACAHFGIGLFEVGYRFRFGGRGGARLGWAVSLALALIGINALLAFVSPRGRWLERGAERTILVRSTR